MTVPNRAGNHRALLPSHVSMYAAMGNEQLNAVHKQATQWANSGDLYLVNKGKARLKYTTNELASRANAARGQAAST